MTKLFGLDINLVRPLVTPHHDLYKCLHYVHQHLNSNRTKRMEKIGWMRAFSPGFKPTRNVNRKFYMTFSDFLSLFYQNLYFQDVKRRAPSVYMVEICANHFDESFVYCSSSVKSSGRTVTAAVETTFCDLANAW